jgi:uncharacterized protein (TIGR00369 family)
VAHGCGDSVGWRADGVLNLSSQYSVISEKKEKKDGLQVGMLRRRGRRGKLQNAMTKKMSKEEKRVTELVRRRMKESSSTELLGFDVESVHEGRAIFRLDVRPNHKQIHGVVHGGILAALADTTAAIAAYTTIPKGTEIATVELSINYLEPVPGGRIKADARVLRSGRNFVVTECEIFNEDGSLAAKALLTFGATAGHSLQK